MAECDNNPQTPVYSKARPIIKEGCISPGGSNMNNFYNPALLGKTAEVLAGDEISVDDISDSAVDRFRVHYDPTVQLVVSLALIPRDEGIIQVQPILKGIEVDRIDTSWSYNNQAVVTQTLINTAGLSIPTLGPADRSHNYTGIAVTDDMSVTVDGDTGEGHIPESTDSDTKSVLFGNYLAWGADVSLDGLAESSAQTYFDNFIAAAQTNIQRARGATIFGLGNANQKFLMMYPKAWGLGSFFKEPFAFGNYRVKLVNGTLKHDLGGGETEEDIILDNGLGYTEAYYIYETFFTGMDDQITPIEIT